MAGWGWGIVVKDRVCRRKKEEEEEENEAGSEVANEAGG